MPKPTQAELLQRFALPIVPSKLEAQPIANMSANRGLTGSRNARRERPGDAGGSLSSASTSREQASSVSVEHLQNSLTFSPPISPCPSLTLSYSLSSLRDPHARSFADDDDSSGWPDFESSDGNYTQMCRPSEAKALSIATGRFYAVSSLGRDGLVPDDEPPVDGMILHGYTDGKPVYYKYSGIHADLKAIETETVFGTRYILQPIESCFGRFHADIDENSGYTIQQKSESILGAGDEAPPNRTFSNEWFKVCKSSLGGYGVFASRDIEPCTSILLERPFLSLRTYNTLRQKYEKLSPEEMVVFDGLHAFAKNQTDELVKRANANSFMCEGGEAIFAIASNFNHACHMKRNTQYHWDPWRRVMVFTTDSHVAEGEELLISYGEGRMLLQEKFGFLCNCGSCESPSGWTLEASVY